MRSASGGRQRSLPVDPLRQGLTIDERHDEPGERTLLLDLVDRDDVGMGEPRRGPCFPEKAVPKRRDPGELGGEQLDRHRAVQGEVAGQEHDAHAAAAQLPLDREPPRHRILEGEELGGRRAGWHGVD